MDTILQGTVKGGVIVPEAPLPEGARVEIRVVPLEMPPEWQEDFEAWNLASAKALELVERQLAEENESGETHLVASRAPILNWLERVIGSIKGEPAFEEVLEYGRAMRQADRPSVDSES